MAKDLFTVTDCLGRKITCTHSTWHGHIIKGHKMMRGNLNIVKDVVSTPDLILTSSTVDNIQVYFKATPTATYGNNPKQRITKVAVAFDDDDNGDVRTAYPAPDFKGGVDCANPVYP